MKMIDQTLPTIDFQPQNPVVLPIGLLKLKPQMIQMWSKPIPQETLEHSWKKIILTSQKHFPPTSKYINKNVLEDGMMVATLRYDHVNAFEILGVKVLPIISSHDTKLLNLIMRHHHAPPPAPGCNYQRLHLNKSMTLHKMRTGLYASVTSHIGNKINNFISNCPVCKRTSKIRNLQTQHW